MSPKKEIIGQEILPEMPERVNPYRRDLERQLPFGALVSGDFWGRKETDYIDITPAMVELASVVNLSPDLFERPRGKRFVIDSIAVTTGEYADIVRNFEKQDEQIAAKADSGRWQLASTAARKRHVLEERREGVHSSVIKMGPLIETYESRIKLLDTLKGYAATPGYRRRKNINVTPAMEHIINNVFSEMLEVIGQQRKWTETQADFAKRSMEKRLFFDGRNRIKNWREMLELASLYTRAKQAIIKKRLKVGDKLLSKIEAEEAELA